MMCADALFIVFLLDADMRYALVYGNGVWTMGSVRFPTCVSRRYCRILYGRFMLRLRYFGIEIAVSHGRILSLMHQHSFTWVDTLDSERGCRL